MSQNVVLAFLRRRQYNASIRYPPNPVPSAKALKFNPNVRARDEGPGERTYMYLT